MDLRPAVVQEQDSDLVEEGSTLDEEDSDRLDEELSVPDAEDHQHQVVEGLQQHEGGLHLKLIRLQVASSFTQTLATFRTTPEFKRHDTRRLTEVFLRRH